jgi:hypothetical protein
MQKLYFGAKALKVYSEDIDNLQDSIQSEIVSIFKQTIEPTSDAAVIQGFDIFVDDITTPANTKFMVRHPKGVGSFLTKSGNIVIDSATARGISLASQNAGDVNVICVERYVEYGSYDKVNDTFLSGSKKNIDLSDQTLVFDRVVDKCRIVVFTLSDFESLQNKNNIVELGRVTAKGVGSVYAQSDISNTKVYVQQKILNNSITLEKFHPDIQIPQWNVDSTLVSRVNDSFTGTPNTLEDNINQIRTEIKQIKDTSEYFPSWDAPPPSSLANVNPYLLATHKDGVCKGYESELSVSTHTDISGVDYVTINEGKYVFNGETRTVYSANKPTLALDPIELLESGTTNEASVVTTNEKHWIPNLANYEKYIIVLDKKRIKKAIINESENNSGSIRVYTYDGSAVSLCVRGSDYTVIDGDIVVLGNGSIDGEYIYVYYTYSFIRYDAIDFGADGTVHITKGETPLRDVSSGGVDYPYEIAGWMPSYKPSDIPNNPSDPSNPNSKNFYLRFWVIERVPFRGIEDTDLIDCRFYLIAIKDTTEIPANAVSRSNFSLNKFSYCAPDGTLDTENEFWAESTKGNKPYKVANIAKSSCNVLVYTKDKDDVFIRCSKSERLTNIRVEIEKNTKSDIYELVFFSLISASPVDDEPILINYDFTEGYHKIKITLQNDSQFKFWGMLVGNTELQYTHSEDSTYNKSYNNNYIANNLIVGSPQSIGGVTIPLVLRALWTGFGSFKNGIYLFNSESTSYYVYDVREEVWSQRTFNPPNALGVEHAEVVGSGVYHFTNDFIFIAPKNTDVIYYTADGVKWFSIWLGTHVVIKKLNLINNILYVLLDFNTDVYFRVYGNFAKVEQVSFPSKDFWLGVEYYNGKYIAYKKDGYYITSDPYSWGTTLKHFTLKDGTVFDITYDNDQVENTWLKSIIQENYFNFCLIGSNNDILISKDLEVWENYKVPNIEKILDAVYLQDYIFVVPMSTGNVRANFYWRTLDFKNWVKTSLIEETASNLICVHNTNVYVTRPFGTNIYDYRITNTGLFYGDVAIIGDTYIQGTLKGNMYQESLADIKNMVFSIPRKIDALVPGKYEVFSRTIANSVATLKLKQAPLTDKVFSFAIEALEDGVSILGAYKTSEGWGGAESSSSASVTLSSGQTWMLASSTPIGPREAELFVSGKFRLYIHEEVSNLPGDKFIGSVSAGFGIAQI